MMQQGVSPAIPISGDPPPSSAADAAAAAAVAAAAAGASGSADLGSSGFSEDERGRIDDGGRNSGGNRWPKQETLYLLKIRSDMDAAFRDSSLKGPLWDEVSRKLAELGYHRSGKKCKEKFENVYKYNKRIKENRTSKSDGKSYKFSDQLQALEASPAAVGGGGGGSGSHNPPPVAFPPPPPVVSKPLSPMGSAQANPISMVMPQPHQNNVDPVDPISVAAPAVTMPAMNVGHMGRFPFPQLNMSTSTISSSSSTSSDDEPPERRRNRKRKWKEFFGRLMQEVVDKQEELQAKFIDTLERRERDRMAREEAWRMQEMAKMKREHELLAQERSIVAAKDAAIIAFLQKISDQNPNTVIPSMPAMQLLHQQQQQQQPQQTQPRAPTPSPPPPQPPPPTQQPPPPSQEQAPPPLAAAAVPINIPVPVPALPAPPVKTVDNGGGGGGVGESMLQPSPSRWPKAEINALIQIRTTLDTKYQENGPKGPLWEEVSAAMRNLGYNRNAKRCKEKWENINKYYKKVKESSKKRPEDSKTCPYFHQLDAIYREKASATSSNNNINTNTNNNPVFAVKTEAQMAPTMPPIMARPEQQWPLPAAVQEQHHQYQQQQQQQQQAKFNEPRGDESHRNADLNEEDYDDDDDEDDDDEEEEGGEYEIVPNKTSSMAAN